MQSAPNNNPAPPPHAPVQEGLARRILDAIGSLRYGTVEVVVHDGQVVQIDRKERIRVERPGK